MVDSSREGDESSTNTSHKRQRVLVSTNVSSNNIERKKKRTATLLDLDVIDCSVCLDTLTIPIFQCDNSHVVCSTCCIKLRQRCAICSLPTRSRNRAMERVLELLRSPCPNAEFGCSEDVSYDKKSRHLEQCAFTQRRCPFSSCDFTGSNTDLCKHSVDEHYNSLRVFRCGVAEFIYPESGKRVVFMEDIMEDGEELVVVECFETPSGRIFYASCIGPMVPRKGKFTYSLSLHSSCADRLCFESSVKRVREVSCEPPDKFFMFVPSYMCPDYKLTICINRLTFFGA